MNASRPPTIMWFRSDLRVADHDALTAAAGSGRPVLACYVLDDRPDDPWAPGGASRWWLHESLDALAAELEKLGGRLILRRGPAQDAIAEIVKETGARTVHRTRSAEPESNALEAALRSELEDHDAELQCHPGALLFGPDPVRTKSGGPLKVFTPFWKACQRLGEPETPAPVPKALEFYQGEVESETLDDWELRPTSPDWAGGFCDVWVPGEAGAHRRLEEFLDDDLARYEEGRDRPDLSVTSSLSPHLHFGELSPRQVWHAVRNRMAHDSRTCAGGDAFLRQLVWREFSYYLLHHWPSLPTQPFREEFTTFPWHEDPDMLARWQRGETGYPIVDAGMRQLWRTGWMHNRVRMVVASFLVKHLLIPWQDGARWFWDTLVDADLANNSASWQWVAGCGADAAPYFRIFNPILQGRKVDPDGRYVHRWVPELEGLEARYVHEPWNAPQDVLDEAGIVLGRDYPHPIIEHGEGRAQALAAYEAFKESMREG